MKNMPIKVIVRLLGFSAFWIEMKRNDYDLFFDIFCISLTVVGTLFAIELTTSNRIVIAFYLMCDCKILIQALLPLAFPQSHFAHIVHTQTYMLNLLDQKYKSTCTKKWKTEIIYFMSVIFHGILLFGELM